MLQRRYQREFTAYLMRDGIGLAWARELVARLVLICLPDIAEVIFLRYDIRRASPALASSHTGASRDFRLMPRHAAATGRRSRISTIFSSFSFS